MEGAVIQAAERARPGLRQGDQPLDIHIWSDTPVPELGPVKPVLRDDLMDDLDGEMLATGGMWLMSIRDAVQAYPDLFSASGLKQARTRRGGKAEDTLLIGYLIRNVSSALVQRVVYQRVGNGQRPARAVALAGVNARAWLTARLGPLKRFRIENGEVKLGA